MTSLKRRQREGQASDLPKRKTCLIEEPVTHLHLLTGVS